MNNIIHPMPIHYLTVLFFLSLVLILSLVGFGLAGYTPLDQQVCRKERTELRDSFEAALWLRSGVHGHVSIIKNGRGKAIKAKKNGRGKAVKAERSWPNG
jgi:hypothetical protein